MTNQAFDILAYSQSPKTTKRTRLQDELEAAVAVRARKTTSLLFSEELDEDGDDFLDNLLKPRRNRIDAFKASKTKSIINDFDFSDDDEKEGTKKGSSFLKSLKRFSLDDDMIASQFENETASSCQLSSEGELGSKSDEKLASHCPTKDNSSKSLSCQSDNAPLDLALPFHTSKSPELIRPESGAGMTGETHCEEHLHTSLEANLKCEATSGVEKETPTPKPRQRTVKLKINATEKNETSPTPLATNICDITDVSSPEKITARSCISHLTDGCRADSCASNGFSLGDTKDLERASSTSLKVSNQESGEHPIAQVTQVLSKSDVRASSSQSQRPNTLFTKKVESKYLGTLKILDRKDCQSHALDSLRAAVYQEWLRKKKEKSSENLNKEKILQEQTKKRAEEKKKDAAASYEAWKEKKEKMLKAKTKEDKHRMKKEQRAVEEVEEKRKAAEQVFFQWKREHDDLLKEKCRKQRETERKLALKKQKEDEERKRDSKSAFSNWCEKKTDALYKKVSTERQETKNKEEEHRYLQEEKDKMAIEMYEQWLAKKDMQQKRQREERRIQVILRDSPPPPWSPPNRTIQFRK